CVRHGLGYSNYDGYAMDYW
nr:immunoglobulin heavy chain junction region [Mus musculus]